VAAERPADRSLQEAPRYVMIQDTIKPLDASNRGIDVYSLRLMGAKVPGTLRALKRTTISFG